MVLEELEHLSEEIKRCTACNLYNSRTQAVPGTYGEVHGLCFIGEAPGFYEDKQGLPFVGRSGKLLDNMLREIGLSRGQVSILNVVKCRPTNEKGENRTPTTQELTFCGSKWLTQQLNLLSPRLIVSLGGIALKFFFPNLSVTKVAGKLLDLPSKQKLFATYHPAYILRNFSLLERYEEHFLAIKEYYNKLNIEETMDINKKEKTKMQKKPRQRSLTDFF